MTIICKIRFFGEAMFPKNSQYLVNGESNQKNVTNKKDGEFNFQWNDPIYTIIRCKFQVRRQLWNNYCNYCKFTVPWKKWVYHYCIPLFFLINYQLVLGTPQDFRKIQFRYEVGPSVFSVSIFYKKSDFTYNCHGK